ncbi:DEAD/DEAH box helicase [Sporolactobacillus shoreicorticis]|uniref:SNF2-related protein n=1 Tax=Sporolactobacillus shoreicorticis TaxID=1923877 RepID=A0ABW5SCM1_9BACL|nr:DEAD/DEAH box helicase [Sporolactobacillus shoreicorticis]MCO7127284.1 DEAD/DEAH box helicase [Sporolactobacillus shoreicorticis]
MDRFLQMTFIPHIENSWNFFLWFTDINGEVLPFPSRSADKKQVPGWLSETSAYPFFPYRAKFIDDKSDADVDGVIMPMAGVFRLIHDGAIREDQLGIFPGLTVQWFRQLSEAVDSLLENGLFYPFFYHLKRGKEEQCYFCHWIPDARVLAESGLFADWLSRLPRLAFSIDELQDQRVQQWVYLVVIYWLNTMIRSAQKATLNQPIELKKIDHDAFLNQIENGNPLIGTDKPWMVLHDPQQIEQMDQLEFELAGWVRPVASAQSDSWAQALLNYKREQMEAYFVPEEANLILKPANADDLFSVSSIWDYTIKICGWQNGRRAERSPEEVAIPASLSQENWLSKRLNLIKGQIPESIVSLFKGVSDGCLSIHELSDLYQYEDILADASILVVFPENVAIQDAPSVTVDLDIHQKKSGSETSLFSLDSLITYDWRIAIGDIQLSTEKFRQLVRANQPFIHQGNQWIHLPVHQMMKAYEEMEDALSLFDTKPSVSAAIKIEATRRRKRNGRIKMNIDSEIGNYLSQLLKKPSRSVPVPDTFVGSLRSYQKRGYTWLVNLRRQHVGGCLADDMGLGKTVQAIAYLDYCKQHPEEAPSDSTHPKGPALIICPTSLVANWNHECAAFSPQLDLYIHHGTNRLRGKAFHERLRACDVIVTSYAIYTKEAGEMLAYNWSCVILDEAQAIKNPRAQKTRALRPIKTAHRLVLTGTPIENRLEELWSIMNFLNPGYLGSLERFRAQFIHPIEKKNNRSKARQLTQMIRPFLLRREKTDKKIIRDLPEKVEATRICNLTKNQASLYQSIVNRLKKNVAETGGIQRKGLILSTLTKLKQVCDHPSLVSDPSAAGDWSSGKLDLLFQILDPLFEQDEKVLLFTQYVKMGKLLLEEVQRKYPDAAVFFLNGALNAEQRQKMIDKFQSPNHKKTLFILSLKAGGVGINLTEAGYVIHYDRWWNPAVEEQATDRAYRIGQEHNVYVYKLICEGTLEERIDRLIERKKSLQKQILSGGESWLTEMSDQELLNLIQLHEGVV